MNKRGITGLEERAMTQQHDDDDPLWEGIRAPWKGITNYKRYLRAEFGHKLCKKRPFVSTFTCDCPVEDDDADDHEVTISLRGGECDDVSLKCEEGHKRDEILEAILDELDD